MVSPRSHEKEREVMAKCDEERGHCHMWRGISFGGCYRSGPRDACHDPEVDAPTDKIEVAPLNLMDVEMVEAAPAVALPSLLVIVEEEEVQLTRLLVSAVLVELVTSRIVEEEVPISMGSLEIDSMAM